MFMTDNSISLKEALEASDQENIPEPNCDSASPVRMITLPINIETKGDKCYFKGRLVRDLYPVDIPLFDISEEKEKVPLSEKTLERMDRIVKKYKGKK